MYKVVEAHQVGRDAKQFWIEAPRIAGKQKPGQFVILRLHENGERIPLTLKDANPHANTICVVAQCIGKTTSLLHHLNSGDYILDLVGPLGRPSEIAHFGNIIVVIGGVGAAMAFQTTRALKQAGNRVTVVHGARNADLMILQHEIAQFADEYFAVTDDGSCGRRGVVTEPLLEKLAGDKPVDYVLAVGPVPMMRAVSLVTVPRQIKTSVRLSSIMVDGTGMCGGCRVLLGNTSKFACVDGPEFDASLVNFDVLMQRDAMYREREREALARFEQNKQQELARLLTNAGVTHV